MPIWFVRFIPLVKPLSLIQGASLAGNPEIIKVVDGWAQSNGDYARCVGEFHSDFVAGVELCSGLLARRKYRGRDNRQNRRFHAQPHGSNENKMSDGGRERASVVS